MSFLFAEAHEDDVRGQAMEPGGEGGLAAEGVDFAEELKERFLGKILGFAGIAKHAEAKSVDAAGVLAVEIFERGGVTALSAEDCCVELDGWRRRGNWRLGGTRLGIRESFHCVSLGARR